MPRHATFPLSLIVALCVMLGAAQAEPRVALVIGNSNYGGDLGQLANPANDAKLMAKTLRSIGFDVVEVEDADQQAMKQAIADFGEKLSDAGDGSTGLFFYAGHGVQVGGTNYLIPVHVAIKREAEVDIQAVPVDTVLKQMNWAGSAVNIVILDACRNNPLTRSMRDMSQGLAEIAVKPRGSFISYSTAPGDVAEDGSGADSPYTTALAEAIVEPGKSLNDVFQEVRGKVLRATDQKQTPWDSSSLTAPFFFVPAAAPAAPPPAPSSATAGNGHTNGADSAEIMFWNDAKLMNSADAYQAYLDQYPDGTFVKLAKLKIQVLQGASPAAAVPGGGEEAAASGSATPEPAAPTTTASPAPAPAEVASKSAPGPVVAAPSAPAENLPPFTDLSATLYPADKARVRAAPALDAAVLARVSTDTVLTATGRSEDRAWWRVALPDGRTGYVLAGVVGEQPPASGSSTSSGAAAATSETASATAGKKDSDVCPTASGSAAADRADACKRVLAATDLAKDTKVTALVDYGNALDDLGRGDEALQQYRTAINLDPKSAAAYYNMGLVHQNEGRFAEARAAFDKAASLNPDDPDAIYQRGVTLGDIGDISSALSDVQRAIQMKADSSNYYDELAFLRLANGEIDPAEQAMDHAISVDSTFWSGTGIFTYYLGGRLKDALGLIDAGMKNNPDYSYWELWKALAQKAQYDDAGAAATLAAGIRRIKKNEWPRPLLEYAAGNINEARLRALAQSLDRKTAAERLCEISYYIGELAYLKGDKATARAAMQAAVDARIYHYLEYAAAQTRLAQLNR